MERFASATLTARTRSRLAADHPAFPSPRQRPGATTPGLFFSGSANADSHFVAHFYSARNTLADVGLDGPEAANDIRELRGLLEAFNTAKHTAWQTVVRLVTTGFLLALVAGAAIKLKLMGGGQ